MRLGTPTALVVAQCQLQDATILEEAVRDPVLGVLLSVERGTLDVNILVVCVEVDVPDRGCLAGDGMRKVDLREEGRHDKIDILSAHRPHSHHGQRAERGHGTCRSLALGLS